MKCTDENGLRWHYLNGITEGGQDVEVMAATSIDGIGVIVRWKKHRGGWTAHALCTESERWDKVDQSEEGNEIPPEPPLVWDDISRNAERIRVDG